MNIKFIYLILNIILLTKLQVICAQIIFPGQTPTRDSRALFPSCYTPSRRAGVCVPIRQCRNLWSLILKQAANQATSNELNFLRSSQCGTPDVISVCCEQQQVDSDNPTTQTRPTVATQPTRPLSTNLLPKTDECAFLSNRIIGGVETELGQYPWLALIEYSKGSSDSGHHCGGSLINNRYVLTAAHCIRNPKMPRHWRPAVIRLGEHDVTTDPDCAYDLNNNEECAPRHLDIRIEKTILHPDYDQNSLSQVNDIALIRLSQTVQYNAHVKPICLPIDPHLRNQNLTGSALDIAGWGRTETGYHSTRKLRATVDVVSLPACNRKFSTLNVVLTESQICAGGRKGVDSCNGDSGGPLIGSDNSDPPKAFLVGVVSFGRSRCGEEGWPGVYTNVASHINWIAQNLEP